MRAQIFFAATLDVMIVLAGLSAAEQLQEEPWHAHTLVGMEVGPTGAQFGYSDPNDPRYCAQLNGRDIVRSCVVAGSEYLVLWARDGDYAYYNSKILPKAAGLGDRDLLREAIDEARQHKLPVIAYCVVQQGGHYLKEHPEFQMRGADGKALGRFCLNSGYRDAMKAIIAEQLAYGVDGFHIDMIDQGFGPPYGCWCETCQREFIKEFGCPMPPGPTWDEDWDRMLQFRYRSSERFEKALAAHVKSLDPRVSVDFNYHGNPPFSFEVGQRPVQHAGNGDFVTGETGVWGFSALTVGLNAEFYRAAAPGQRVQVAMQRGVRMYHDQTTRPLHDIRWELFNLLAHGAFVTIVDKTFQNKSSLETLIGGRFVRKLDSMDNWVQFAPTESNAGKAITEGISHARPIAFGTGDTESVPFLVKGPAAVIEPTTAETAGQLFTPYRTTRQRENKEGTEWPMSAEAPVGPAILIHHVGKGTVLTFACSPDYATGSEHHIAEARRLLANAVRFLHPEPRVRITAPAAVEAVVTDDSASRTLRVHLLGYNAPPQTTPTQNRPYVMPATIEDVPTFQATVELDRPVKDASEHLAATEIKWHGMRIEATVHDIHEVIVARY